ncbi:hypothetical protein, partial [Roseobacter sp.]|uniref:hypothetical protein n=1 Tax=Roseobacter sp. TaxID=1907202 RepID=UPI00385ABF1D
MGQADTLLKLYGTSDPPQVLRDVSVGPLSFLYSQDGLRRISWHGTELVRALAWPIRDESWGTYPAKILGEEIDETGGFEANLTFAVGKGRLVCDLRLRASIDGVVAAEITMTPTEGPFATNRAGFTVLHPIKGFAGASLDVTHSNGTTETTTFPRHIQPDQPVKDIGGLSYGLGKHSVDITFGEEVFEMEDQRNWSDASYKTYCVPLVHPFVYEITKPLRQSIRMNFKGDVIPATANADQQAIQIQTSDARAPNVGLALEKGWIPQSPISEINAAHVLLRTSPGDRDLPRLADFAKAFPAVDLEIVLPNDAPVDVGLREVADAFASQGVTPARVLVLPEAYLGSHQPTGPWPDGVTPNDLLDATRSAFTKSDIGGGMMTNFTEVNRCRPDTTRCDYVTHGLTPLVHAGDDMSVLE